jgi:hypothetical protein
MYFGEVEFLDETTDKVVDTAGPEEAFDRTGHVDRCADGFVWVYHRKLKDYVRVDANAIQTRQRRGMTPRGEGGSRPLAADALRR